MKAFEALLEGFIQNSGSTLESFYKALREQQEIAAEKNSQEFMCAMGPILNAAISFDSFVELMVDVREGRGVCYCPPLVSVK